DWVLASWRRLTLARPDAPLIGLVREEGELVVALPLMRRRRLLFVSELGPLLGLLPPTQDALVRKGGDARPWLEALIARLGREAPRLCLDMVPDASPLVTALDPAKARRRVIMSAWEVAMEAGPEAYLASRA